MSQQLDLFGAPITPHQPLKVDAIPVETKVEEIVEVKNAEEVTVADDINIEENVGIIETIEEDITNDNVLDIENIFSVEQKTEPVETVYQSLMKRHRGRPRKERPLIEEPKIKQKRGRKSFTEIATSVDLIDVPSDEELSKKQYYSISTVAKWFNANNSQIRLWENQFDILKPKKNGKGDRFFRQEDIKNLKLIYHLLRERKYSVEGAKEYLKTNRNKANSTIEIKDTLQNLKSFLLELKVNLQ